MKTYADLAELTGTFLQNPAFTNVLQLPPSQRQSFTPLPLPAFDLSLRNDLLRLHCSEQGVASLEKVFRQACQRLEEAARRAYASTAENLRTMGSLGSEEEKSKGYLSAVETAVRTKFVEDVQRIRTGILNDVRQAITGEWPQATISPTPLAPSIPTIYPLPSPPPEPVGSFTEEVVSILQKAFDMSESLTRAEVKELIKVTGLNNKQIRTWFANARQRRGRKAAPYSVPRRPTQSKQPSSSTPLRNVSNSSNSSFSSLVSYASTISEDSILPQNVHDSPVLERSPSYPQAQSLVDEEEDVPMNLSSSVFNTPSSEYPPALSIPSAVEPVVPPAPSTAETDRFFFSSQQQSNPLPSPQSHQHPTTNPASQFFDVQYSQATDNSSSNSLSFLNQLQSTDPFLDDQFLKNVFGTLGVTQGGGLTLTMDSFRDEELGSGGGGGEMGEREEGAGMMLEFAASGGNGGSFGW